MGPVVLWGGWNEPRAERLTVGERNKLQGLSTYSQNTFRGLERVFDAEYLAARAQEILALDNPAIGSRQVDPEGYSPIHRFLMEEFERLAPYGLEYLGAVRGMTGAPVSLDRLLDGEKRGEPASITAGGRSFSVHPLWPNGAMPSLTPEDGLEGPLVYVGDGEWDDIAGLDLRGAIALMRFSGGRNHERFFAHGVIAVVVVEDDHVGSETAENLFTNTPLPYPRFYADTGTGLALVSMAWRKESSRGNTEVITGTTARLHGGAVYEERPFNTLFAWIPPTQEVEVTLRPGTLLELIAGEFGVDPGEIMQANDLDSPELEAGQELRIPGQGRPYRVRRHEVRQRLAAHYGVTVSELEAFNGWDDSRLEPGEVVRIPNVDESMVVFFPTDSVSVVPDLPHGGQMAGNLAVGLAMMEHLATDAEAVRRKGLLFVFLDGDTLGGMGSRTFTEYVMLAGGDLRTAMGDEISARLGHYESARDWFDTGMVGDDETARWLGGSWLASRFEDIRVSVAEERIQVILSLQGDPSPGEQRALRPRLSQLDAKLQKLLVVRLDTLENRRLSWPGRVEHLYLAMENPEFLEVFGPMGLSIEALIRRYDGELQEERWNQLLHQNNLEVAHRVMNRIHPNREEEGTRPRLGWFFDLSSGSGSMGIQSKDQDHFRVRLPIPRIGSVSRDMENRIQAALAHGAVLAGWSEEWTFPGRDDRREFPFLPFKPKPTYAELWAVADVASFPVGTYNDRLENLDTPRDVPQNMDFGNLAVQGRNAAFIVRLGLENPDDSAAPPRLNRPRVGSLTGRTLRLNVRSGLDAQDPVPGTYVYYPGIRNYEIQGYNSSTYRGMRKGVVMVSRLNGQYRLPAEILNWGGAQYQVYAYHLDRARANFVLAANEGRVGPDRQLPRFQLQEGRESQKDIVLTEIYPLVFFPGSDPSAYQTIGGTALNRQTLRVIDAVRNGEPQYFAFDNPSIHYSETSVEGNILYMPPGSRGRVIAQSGVRFPFMMVGLVEEGEGRGMLVGPQGGDRNLYVPFTPLVVAEQMQQLSTHRQRTYAAFGITSQTIDGALERSQAKLDEARLALDRGDWQSATGAARESWGMLVKQYPRILRLGREAVFSVIVLMAFLLPACVFLEKLIIGSKGIIARLVGTTALFLCGVLFLNTFHPAFRIAVSPFIVVIAFTMILMSAIVLVICYQRFDTLVRRARIAGGEIESEEIGLMSSLATAFSLGVSNLKKRPSRTFLTALTVTILTFSIVAFVSVSGRDTVSRRALSLDTDVEGRAVDPLPPAYEGALFRSFQWNPLQSPFLSAVESEFGARFELTRRGHFIEEPGGTHATQEGSNQVEIRRGDRSHIVIGLMTFEPAEVRFSGLHRAVSGDTWFRTGDRHTLIIPDTAAEDLRISPDMILDADGNLRPDEELPTVQMMSIEWRVIGILDVEQADRIRDVNGRSLAMVDYLRSAMRGGVRGELINERTTAYHHSWRDLALVPYAARQDVEARTRAVVLRFEEGDDVEEFYEDIALRLNQPFFAHVGGDLSLITTRQDRSIGGLAKIIVPIILCVLIVLNTMMGTVDERRGEVGMLGAVGLSPRQISFLLLSESTVFSVLGIVFGIFIGLFFANMIPYFTASGFTAFSALSFNFTALSSLVLAMGTGLVVLLATLIPAKKAAALAAPSGMENWELPPPSGDGRIHFQLPFTLTRGNAIGMAVFIRQFLLHHTEPTSDDFNCRRIRLSPENSGGKPVLRISADMWLAPYDLDVSQHLEMRIAEGESDGVFQVTINLERISGAEEAWLRTNYAFINLVRHQFLMWRNLDQDSRDRMIAAGRETVRESRVVPT